MSKIGVNIDISSKELWEHFNYFMFYSAGMNNFDGYAYRLSLQIADLIRALYYHVRLNREKQQASEQQTPEEIALGLWRAWFKSSGKPYEYGQDDEVYCFFCGAGKGQHIDDCPYVEAAKLLGEEWT